MTGAARGIGAAIAAALRADGMEVVTIDLAEGCDIRLDVARDDFPDLGDVDVCVPNAAITTTIAPAHRMTPEQWQRDIDVNLTGAFRTVQACLGGMRERGYGRIVAISSGAAESGLPGPGRLQRLEGRPDRDGEDDRRRERRARHHRERRAARVRRDRAGARDAARRARARHAGAAGRAHGDARPRWRRWSRTWPRSDAGYVTGQTIGIDGGLRLNTRSIT